MPRETVSSSTYATAGDGDAALARVDLRVGESELGLKSNNRETDGERQIAAPKSPSPLAWRQLAYPTERHCFAPDGVSQLMLLPEAFPFTAMLQLPEFIFTTL